MKLINAFPEIYRAYDEKSGNVLRLLMNAFDTAVEEAQKEIEDFPSLIDLESCPDELLPYLLRNLANPFPTDSVDFAKNTHDRWIIGYTEIGGISERRTEDGVKLDPGALRNLGGQLFEIYKRKGTKLGIIMACRAVALADVFIADLYTDSAASFRHGKDNKWVLGESQIQALTNERVYDDAPYCEICEGRVDAPEYSDSYGVPEAQCKDIEATIKLYEDYEIYDGYIVFEVNITSEYLPLLDIHFQYSETGGFTWKTAKGWIATVPLRPEELWTLDNTSLKAISDRQEVTGIIKSITPGRYYFIFDPDTTGLTDRGLRWIKFRTIPFSTNKLMGNGGVTEPFQYLYGINSKEIIDPDIIPAIISDYPYSQQHWTIGETPYGILSDNINSKEIFNKQRKAQFHFEVIIISAANKVQKKLITEIVNYMKPAHTHYSLIEGNEVKTSHGAWVINETNFGSII